MFPKILFTTKQGKTVLKCHTDNKAFKKLHELAAFLPDFRRFVTEFAMNHNYVEQDLNETDELDQNLFYRKFVIFPVQEGTIYLVRKIENEREQATIHVDFLHRSFLVELRGQVFNINSFNAFLLNTFLCIDPSDKILVKSALGYRTDIDFYTGKKLESKSGLSGDSSLDPHRPDDDMLDDDNQPTLIMPEEKRAALDSLRTQISGKSPGWTKLPYAILRLLNQIMLSIQILQRPYEKNEWIKLEIIPLMLDLFKLNDTQERLNDRPQRIISSLCSQNPEGSDLFCTIAFQFLSRNMECVGVYSTLSALCSTDNAFRTIFVKRLGVHFLLSIYSRASTLLLGEQSDIFGRQDFFAATPDVLATARPPGFGDPGSSRRQATEHSEVPADSPLQSPLPPVTPKPTDAFSASSEDLSECAKIGRAHV